MCIDRCRKVERLGGVGDLGALLGLAAPQVVDRGISWPQTPPRLLLRQSSVARHGRSFSGTPRRDARVGVHGVYASTRFFVRVASFVVHVLHARSPSSSAGSVWSETWSRTPESLELALLAPLAPGVIAGRRLEPTLSRLLRDGRGGAMPSKRATETATGGDFAASRLFRCGRTPEVPGSSSAGSTTAYAATRVDDRRVSSRRMSDDAAAPSVFSPSSRRASF